LIFTAESYSIFTVGACLISQLSYPVPRMRVVTKLQFNIVLPYCRRILYSLFCYFPSHEFLSCSMARTRQVLYRDSTAFF